MKILFFHMNCRFIINLINKTYHLCKMRECRYTHKILNKYNCLLFYVHNSWTIYDIFLYHLFYSNHLKWLFFLYALINVFVIFFFFKVNLIYFYFLRKKERKRLMYDTIKQTAVYLKEDMGNMDHNACTKCTNQLVFSI